jgi:hypothetical protein
MADSFDALARTCGRDGTARDAIVRIGSPYRQEGDPSDNPKRSSHRNSSTVAVS